MSISFVKCVPGNAQIFRGGIMKNIFLKPIGTLRDLGTPREWITEIVCMAICAAVLIAALIIL
jgi:hypothetical protein